MAASVAALPDHSLKIDYEGPRGGFAAARASGSGAATAALPVRETSPERRERQLPHSAEIREKSH
jgi:hypothetical protein